MKTKVFSPFFASLIMIGAFVMTSCSNDDGKITEPEQTQNKENLRQQLDDAVTTLNQEMSGLDFKDLAPLTRAITENEGKDTGNMRQGFNTWMLQLLQKLNQDLKEKIPYGFTLGFESVENIFSSVWAVNIEATPFSADFTDRDGSVYHVTLEEKIGQSQEHLAMTYSKERILTITKDMEPLITIRTIKENNHHVVGLMPSMSIDYTGEIIYKEYTISLGYDRAKLHDRTIKLEVNKAGSALAKCTTDVTDNVTLANLLKHDVAFTADYNLSLMNDLILVGGKVNSINKLIGHAVLFVGLRKNGASEDACKELADLFNENMSTNMSILGTNAGTINAAPVFNDKLGKYVPTFMINSPLFGDEPVDINTMLSNLGISIEDIIGVMKGTN